MVSYRRLASLALLLVAATPHRAVAQQPRPRPQPIIRAAWLQDVPNVVGPTMGGTQLWGDELYFGQWRIQRNAVTGHYRLLDPDDVRRASGSLAACQRRLDELKKQGHLQPLRGKVVVVLHGLVGRRHQMSPLVDYLEANSDYAVISVAYPSTRASVADHAGALATIVAGLTEVKEINFVGHSLGNLVVRHYLADCQAVAGGRVDPRIKRIVMLGPPNHGSRLAEALGGNVIFDGTLGTSAQQLARRWRELGPHLATPPCEFGIIAGGKGNEVGFNPLLPGDDDGTVRVAETRLAGASDFTLVDVIHSLMMANAEVQERTLRFLREGRFAADGPRHRIAEEGESAQTADRGVQVQRRAVADDRK
ncbi:MAG: alpha/beta hydrolase [Planctomycetia bacterium]|nr:alpha/beta hydrolase [Planctomycetia bacterium]